MYAQFENLNIDWKKISNVEEFFSLKRDTQRWWKIRPAGTITTWCNPSPMGPCHLDEFSSGCWSGTRRTTEKANASRFLSYSTSGPLYQGTGTLEGQSQEESFAKWSTNSLSCEAQGCGFEPQGRHHLSPIVLKLICFNCLYLLLVGA